jgi:hypothetical protein
MGRGKKIPDAELDDWKRVYPTGGAAAVRALYPHRSRNAINVTCHKRGIKMIDPIGFNCELMHAAVRAGRRKDTWTAEHDDIMRANIHALGSRGMMWMLPFRTNAAIRRRAHVIGLTFSQAPARPTPKRDRLRALFAAGAGQQVSA